MKALDVLNQAINRARTLDEEADAIEAYAAVAALVEAARWIPRAVVMAGPVGTTAHLIAPERMTALREALNLIDGGGA
jgi:hypothetical protein